MKTSEKAAYAGIALVFITIVWPGFELDGLREFIDFVIDFP